MVQLKNIELAIQMYYSKIELSSADIKQLFEVKSSSTVAQLKKKALKLMTEEKKPMFSSHRVNTECAYRAWGFDIADLEKRYSRLKKLGLIQQNNNNGE